MGQAADSLKLTYINGPTALLELGGLRLLTDPTFDAAGAVFRSGAYMLEKTMSPAKDGPSLLPVDAVLLSHDHHFDNLDAAGRSFLESAPRILTTPAGAARLGGHAEGLEPWQQVELTAADGRALQVTATPARHGPPEMDRGPVRGFVLTGPQRPGRAVYISGDTVWYEGVAEVGRRFPIDIAILFMGAARVPAVGPWNLTFTAEEAVLATAAFPEAVIVPLHFEGWAHFTESRREIEDAFTRAGLAHRLRWPVTGRTIEL